MAKGGIVMDVVNVEQARIAEEAGVSFLVSLGKDSNKVALFVSGDVPESESMEHMLTRN